MEENELKFENEKEPPFDFDAFWKDLLEHFWRQAILFFIPKLYEAIDLTRVEFLDKELTDTLKDVPQDEHNHAKFVDKLLKVYLKGGGDAWILFHIEVQGPGGDDLPYRMHLYYCLLFAHYRREITSLAILTAPRPGETNGVYKSSCFGSSVTHRYNSADINDYNDDELLNSDNPFALAVYAARKAMKYRHDEQRKFHYLLTLTRILLERGWSDGERRSLLLFISWVINLKNPELKDKYFDEIDEIKGEHKMVETFIEKHYRDQGISIGMERGREKWRAEGRADGHAEGRAEGRAEGYTDIARNMLRMNFPKEQIAQITGMTPEAIMAL